MSEFNEMHPEIILNSYTYLLNDKNLYKFFHQKSTWQLHINEKALNNLIKWYDLFWIIFILLPDK